MLWERRSKKQEARSKKQETQIATGPDEIRSIHNPPTRHPAIAVLSETRWRGGRNDRIEWIDQSGRETCMCMESSIMLLTYVVEPSRNQSEPSKQ
jgi:hypothetical protein